MLKQIVVGHLCRAGELEFHSAKGNDNNDGYPAHGVSDEHKDCINNFPEAILYQHSAH